MPRWIIQPHSQQWPNGIGVTKMETTTINPALSKPLGRRAYGSIGHLPNSRLGPGDHSVPEGQGRICCVKTRDKHDRVIVQEKLDGSCVAVALADGQLHALGRSGWLAQTSPYKQHQLFAAWVRSHEDRFRHVLREGERLVGEWLAQAHGTIYRLNELEPFGVFDIMVGQTRLPFDEFVKRVDATFARPHVLHDGAAISVDDAMALHERSHWPCEETEGVVYRVERKGEVEYLAKWVRPTKVDGKYLPNVSGQPEVWNWQPPW